MFPDDYTTKFKIDGLGEDSNGNSYLCIALDDISQARNYPMEIDTNGSLIQQYDPSKYKDSDSAMRASAKDLIQKNLTEIVKYNMIISDLSVDSQYTSQERINALFERERLCNEIWILYKKNTELQKMDEFIIPSFLEKHPNSLAFSNIIFNSNKFESEDTYQQAYNAILSFITTGTEDNNKEYQIIAKTQSEWYYILKAIKEAKVAKSDKLKDTDFLHQMLNWYPALFDKNENESTEKMLRRYASSISRERQKWINGSQKKEVGIRDMFALSNTRGYDSAKTLRLHGVAQGLKEELEKLTSPKTK